jgi:hypothetical protein
MVGVLWRRLLVALAARQVLLSVTEIGAAGAWPPPPYALRNRVKTNLLTGNSSFGAFVALFDPAVTEIFGASGLDYLFIDSEHTQITPAVLLEHLRAAGSSGIVPLVRVPGPTEVDNIKPCVI